MSPNFSVCRCCLCWFYCTIPYTTLVTLFINNNHYMGKHQDGALNEYDDVENNEQKIK